MSPHRQTWADLERMNERRAFEAQRDESAKSADKAIAFIAICVLISVVAVPALMVLLTDGSLV